MAEILPVGTVLTTKGQRLIAKLLGAKGALEFTRAAVGSGTLQKGVSAESLIGLLDPKMDANISAYGIENDQAYVTAQVSSEGVTEGFLVTEVGIFAKDPDEGEILYAYMDISTDPTYIYAAGTGNIAKLAEFQLYVLIGQLKSVTAVITPGSFVSKSEFDEKTKELGRVLIGADNTALKGNDTLFVTE